MKSPTQTEAIFNEALTQLPVNEREARWEGIQLARTEELAVAKKQTIELVDTAIAGLPEEPVMLDNYGISHKGTNFAVQINKVDIDSRGVMLAFTQEVYINGLLTRESSRSDGAEFPMYKLVKYVGSGDGGVHNPRYELAVADKESPSGYTPIALAADTDYISTSRSASVGIQGRFGITETISEHMASELDAHNAFVDTNAGNLIDEIKDIVGVAVNQQ